MPGTLCIDVGIKNLAFCLMNRTEDILSVELWKNIDVLDSIKVCSVCGKGAKYQDQDTFHCKRHSSNESKLFKPVKCKTIPLNLLCKKILDGLEFLEELDSNTKVHIESQMSKNPKMKLVSHCIFCRCIQIFGYKNVSFMRATRKLKEVYGDKKTYKERKDLAIVYTRQKLVELGMESWTDKFDESKKKSDLADTFLMCYTILK